MQSSALSSGCPPLTLCIFISEIKELLVLKDLTAMTEVSPILHLWCAHLFHEHVQEPSNVKWKQNPQCSESVEGLVQDKMES